MKKKTLFLLLLLSSGMGVVGFGQKNKQTSPNTSTQGDPEKEYTLQKAIYHAALKNNDLAVATHALYTMIALKPSETNLKDSLTVLYFQRGAYDQCMRQGKEVLASEPKDTLILELVSISEQTLGLFKEALEDYEKLYALAGNLNHLYEMATIQYNIKRLGECEFTCNQIMAHPAVKNFNMTLTDSKGASQRVPLLAAALNLKGVIALDISKLEEARELFNQALKEFPDFALAQGNLEFVNKKLNEQK